MERDPPDTSGRLNGAIGGQGCAPNALISPLDFGDRCATDAAMTDTLQILRDAARAMFDAAVHAADPAPALRRQIGADGLPSCPGRLILIGVGKAAPAMMEEALRHVPDGTTPEALVVTNYENARDVAGATVMAAGHPVPDAKGAAAGQAVIDLLDTAGDEDHVVALISGGGSALLPAPVDGVSLDDKAEVSRNLLGAGFDIVEMNAVRQQVSRLKGGGFTRRAAPAPVKAYILSDVIGDDLRAIASGPTVAPIASRAQVVQLLKERAVWDAMPASVQGALSSPSIDTHPTPKADNTLIASNRHSLDAALAASPLPARIVDDHLTGDVGEAAKKILTAATATPGPCALIFGGETTVNLAGTGLGGRNQELALRVAMEADLTGNWIFLSGGTDGRDGPTEAAGGLVDPGTAGRIGAQAAALLANNDSNAALATAGDLLITGATGTNVADVQILLRA